MITAFSASSAVNQETLLKMTAMKSFLKGKHVLAVDDEEDILETIVEILDESEVDTARDY